MNALEVISFPTPYEDKQAVEQIAMCTYEMLSNELPAFQVDIGADRHLAGTLAVRKIIEDTVNEAHGNVVDPTQAYPFRFTHQNMRAPFYVRPQHARPIRMGPHLDGMQVGPAIHKEYLGRPTKVQFGYVQKGLELFEEETNYEGAGLEAYLSEGVYGGVTCLGRLSIFSQGNKHWGMDPTVHYFEREPDQQFGGRYTRYSMLDPSQVTFPEPDKYEDFAAMRQDASVHLDLWQWKLLKTELEACKQDISPGDYNRYSAIVDDHITGHPGAHYKYWMMTGIDYKDYDYGVVPQE